MKGFKKRILFITFLGIVLVLNSCSNFSDSKRSSSKLTLDQVQTSVREKTLNWDTFENYEHVDVGSGVYLWEYEVEDNHKLLIGGNDLKSSPTQVFLIDSEGNSTD